MAAHKMIELSCDDCDTRTDDLFGDVRTTRYYARRDGWTHRQGRDLCPNCNGNVAKWDVTV